MKKVLSFILFGLLIGNSISVNATTLEQDDPFQECLWEAESDYEITGNMQSAIDVYNDCVDATLEELRDFDLLP